MKEKRKILSLIESHPILKGKCAERFLKEINRERTPEEKANDKKSFKRAKDVYDKVMGNTNNDDKCERIKKD